MIFCFIDVFSPIFPDLSPPIAVAVFSALHCCCFVKAVSLLLLLSLLADCFHVILSG